MFSRRHPYLFFILCFSTIVSIAAILVSIFIASGLKDSEYADMGKDGEKVGIIEVIGVISDSRVINGHLKRFREDESIKAIILRIDSPGGGVAPAQEIFREIMKTVKSKKVIASMGSVAASGGYYIAAATNGIIANPGTLTGSIGVIMGMTNFQELMKKIGLVPVVVKSGEYKDIGSPVREMEEKERKILQNLSDTIHKQFINAVVEGRKMDIAKVRNLADGRIFSGEEAHTMGLVDRLGNLEDAIEWAGKMVGAKEELTPVYAPEKKKTLLKYLMESLAQEIKNQMEFPELYSGYLYQPSVDPGIRPNTR